MNKKLLFGLFAAVSMLFTTTLASCSQDEPTADTTVRFSLKAPAALGDATGVDLLVWAVYDKDGNKLDALCGNKTNAFQATPLTESVPFQLAKGQIYTVVFWAQNSACTVYDYSDLKNIHYTDVTALVANDETLDAFFGHQTFTVAGDIIETIELKRPFAQLNFATTQTELDALTTTIIGSTVKVSEMGTGFNALTGEITSSATDVEFVAATAFTEDITLTLDGTTDTYKHLSMNYILANDATPTGAGIATADVTFTFTTTADVIEIESPATPLQRNWRTNIIGSLTNTGDFNVTITPDFDDENNVTEPAETIAEGVTKRGSTYYIASKAGLLWFEDQVNTTHNSFSGKTIELTTDIDLAGVIWEPIGQTGVSGFLGNFDGKDHTISNLTIDSNTANETNDNFASGLFGWVESASTTIKNIKINGATIKGHHYVAAIVGWTNATIENCHVEGATLLCTHHTDAIGCGDKVGAIVGYLQSSKVINCTAKDCNITAGRDAGTIVGCTQTGNAANVIGCSAENVILTVDENCTHSNKGGNMTGSIIGRLA